MSSSSIDIKQRFTSAYNKLSSLFSNMKITSSTKLFKMIALLIFVLLIIYLLYKYIKSGKKKIILYKKSNENSTEKIMINLPVPKNLKFSIQMNFTVLSTNVSSPYVNLFGIDGESPVFGINMSNGHLFGKYLIYPQSSTTIPLVVYKKEIEVPIVTLFQRMNTIKIIHDVREITVIINGTEVGKTVLFQVPYYTSNQQMIMLPNGADGNIDMEEFSIEYL